MQPITYLNGIPGSLGTLGENELLVVQDDKGNRFIIDPSNMERTEGLGFITDIVKAGATIVGKLIKKKKPAEGSGDAQQSAQQPGLISSLTNSLSAGNNSGGLLDMFKLELKDYVQKSHNQLVSKLTNTTQEQKAIQDKLNALANEQKQAEMLAQLQAQEAKLREQIANEFNRKQEDKTPLYIGLAIAGIATVFLLKDSSPARNGNHKSLNGLAGKPTPGKTRSKRVGKIKI